VVGGTGLLWALDGVAQSWLTFALQYDPPLPGGTASFWFVNRFGAWLLLGLPLLLLLYPDGRLPTGRWRPLAVLSLASTALLPTLLMVVPSEIADARAGSETPAIYRSLDLDPTSLSLPEAVVLPLLRLAFPAALLGVVVPVAAVVTRYRRAGGEERRRMRWLLWAAVVDLLVMVSTVFVPGDEASFALSIAVTLTGAAIAVGILRPRAVDIDRLLGGTLSTARWASASSCSTSPSWPPPARCSATASASATPRCSPCCWSPACTCRCALRCGGWSAGGCSASGKTRTASSPGSRSGWSARTAPRSS
jgi:hypothetical protein